MNLEPTITERRRQTRSSIYKYLYETTEFCSKQSLARELSLSLPTVYQNLNELMEAGLVGYSGNSAPPGETGHGSPHYPGCALCHRHIHHGKQTETGCGGSVSAGDCLQACLPPACQGMHNFGGFMAGELEKFLDENGLDRERMLGVGIALPAVFSKDSGQLTLAPSLSLRDTTVQNLIGNIPYPTYMENDATSGGYAEWFTYGRQRDMAYLLLETGVGGAVLVNGDQYHGDNYRSGEFGHMCVEPGLALQVRQAGLSGILLFCPSH